MEALQVTVVDTASIIVEDWIAAFTRVASIVDISVTAACIATAQLLDLPDSVWQGLPAASHTTPIIVWSFAAEPNFTLFPFLNFLIIKIL